MVDMSKYKEQPANTSKKKDADVESNPSEERENLFVTVAIRNAFMRKVYFTLLIQLLITVAIACVFKYYPNDVICIWTKKYKIVMYVMMGISGVLLIIIVCFDKVRRMFPINIILLLLITIVQGYMLGCVICYYPTNLIFIAGAMTLAVVLALTLFALQTTCDFTVCWGSLLVIGVIFTVLGICCIFVHNKILHMVYCAIGVAIFSIYIVVDTQLILTGKHSYSLTPDDYILGSIMLYIDIINLFILILQLLGYLDD